MSDLRWKHSGFSPRDLQRYDELVESTPGGFDVQLPIWMRWTVKDADFLPCVVLQRRRSFRFLWIRFSWWETLASASIEDSADGVYYPQDLARARRAAWRTYIADCVRKRTIAESLQGP